MTHDALSADRLCEDAAACLETGRTTTAYELLTRARSLTPDHPHVHYLLALYYGDVGRPGDALQAIDASLRLDPGNAKAHNNRGTALERLGRLAEAEEAYRRALDADAQLAPPYLNLGHLLELRNAGMEAAALYDTAIARGLDRALFEQHRAAVSGLTTAASPPAWVRTTFDNFAPVFDATLRDVGYCAPEELARRVRRRAAGSMDILDLGCGTGMCGVALAGAKRRLTGVDLSPKMLQLAARRALYDELVEDEIGAYLASCTAQAFDLIVAADVFIYVGALEGVFREAARVLRRGGSFAFSTEEQSGPDYVLRPSGRYAQAEAYIRRLAEPAFDVLCADPVVIRAERGNPVPGRLYVLERRPGT
jgi:predicted TPR repeat methyltransferase